MTYKADMETFKNVGQRVQEHANITAKHTEANQRICEEKMGNYAALAAEIIGTKLTKGNLPTNTRREFVRAMQEGAGLDVSKKGVGQRYYNGAVGIVRFKNKWDIPTQANAEAIREALETQNINSEAELHKRIAGTEVETAAERVARQWVGSITYRKAKEGEEVFDQETGEKRKAEEGERIPNGFREADGEKYDLQDLYAAIAKAERQRGAFREAAEDLGNKEKTFDQILAALDI